MSVKSEELKVNIADLQTKALAGDVSAQLKLGKMFGTGQGVAKDLKQSMDWLKMAADNGSILHKTLLQDPIKLVNMAFRKI